MARTLASKHSALVCGAALALALTGVTAGTALAAGHTFGFGSPDFLGGGEAGQTEQDPTAQGVNTPAVAPDPVATTGAAAMPDAPAPAPAPEPQPTASPTPEPEPAAAPAPSTQADPIPSATQAPEPASAPASAATQAPEADPAPEPDPAAAPAAPEAAPVFAAADLDQMCRTQLYFYGADGNVPQEDWLQVVVKDGKVWVLQCEGIAAKTSSEVPTAEPEAEAAQAQTDGEPAPKVDFAKLDVPTRTAVRAQLLAELLSGAEVTEGSVKTPTDEAEATAPTDQPTTPAPKPVAATEVTWVVITQKGGTALTAYVFDVPAPADADEAEAATPASPAPTPAFDEDDPNLAVASAKGRWTSADIWPAAGALADAKVERIWGQTPTFQDGTPIVDPKWVVDKAASSEQTWVQDSAAWSEDVYVVDSPAWDEDVLISAEWTETNEQIICYGCGQMFADFSSANLHKMEMAGYYASAIVEDGNPGEYYCDTCSSILYGGDWVVEEHAWVHADVHDVITDVSVVVHPAEYTQVHHDEVGHTERVDHEATGHYETVDHAEEGHWEAPTAPLD